MVVVQLDHVQEAGRDARINSAEEVSRDVVKLCRECCFRRSSRRQARDAPRLSDRGPGAGLGIADARGARRTGNGLAPPQRNCRDVHQARWSWRGGGSPARITHASARRLPERRRLSGIDPALVRVDERDLSAAMFEPDAARWRVRLSSRCVRRTPPIPAHEARISEPCRSMCEAARRRTPQTWVP